MSPLESLTGVLGAGGPPVVVIVRAPDPRHVLDVAQCLVEAGLRSIELTMTTPGAIQAMERVRAVLGDAAKVGMGSVHTRAEAEEATGAGADFLVSAGLVTETIEVARQHDVPVLPGVMTPSEVLSAARTGSPVVKLFPAATLGPGYLTHLRGPVPHIGVVPSGGIQLDDVAGWLRHGAAAVGIGGPLLEDALLGGDLTSLGQRARSLIERTRDVED